MNKKKIREKFLILFSFLIGGIFMLLIMVFTPLMDKMISLRNSSISKESIIYERNSLAKSVEKVYDAVVVIERYKKDILEGNGTGFVYRVDDKYGYILTNEHVITNGETIKIYTTEEKETEATLLGKDEYLDLAVLRIDKKYVLGKVEIGNSETINIGDTIFVVGSPLGYEYRGSVTAGVLSGKDRMVTTSVSNSLNGDWVMRVLQVDASINPGNSGGPILNVNGEVIGICSLKLIDDNIEGMGFAIPIEYAMSHVDALEKGEKIDWPVLGIGMANTTDQTKLYKNDISVTNTQKKGVVVLSVEKNSAAEKAGLQKGDIIIKMNKKNIKNIAYLRYELYQYQAKDTVKITYIRDEKEYTTKVKLK